MSPLDRKLLRDLWRIRAQALAIAAVVAVGVMMVVMMTGLISSLEKTRTTYYERYRLADAFAPVTRAPLPMLDRIAALPGVQSVEGRITGGALIELDDQVLPVRAQAVSLPEFRAPRLNNIYLTDGRRLAPGRTNEVILLKGFADAVGIAPGDHLDATMNGARRSFRVVGLAQAPEFLFTLAPGELAPDDKRFAVLWMNEKALSAAFDMQGAFNEALVGLERGASTDAVVDALDRLLDPYGGLGAYGLADQISNRFISEEISGLKKSSLVAPPIFLGVAAFILYIVITRIVTAEREEIGLIKAFGYTDTEVVWHYFKMVLAIAILGAAMGCLLGVAAGRSMAGLFQTYYKFPFLVFRVDPASFVTGVTVSVLAASAGGLLVLRGVFALTPAVAMRPPAPADYSRTAAISARFRGVFDQPSRMVLRRILRQPGRIFGTVAGISIGISLSVAMLLLLSGFNRTIDLTFSIVDRSDLYVSFIQPLSKKTLLELGRIPGVIEVEPVRGTPAVLRNGARSHRGSVNGLPEGARLNRAVAADESPIDLRGEGVLLGNQLARILDISPGEVLTLEVLDGRRPVLQVPVKGICETLFGSPAYMNIDALNRALGEPGRVNGAYLRIDSARSTAILERLKDMPAVAGLSLKEDSRASMQDLLDSGVGSMRYIYMLLAAIITFGIVFNSARIAFGEQSRDLASLRVIGFSKGEAAFVLLGELAVVVLFALPLGLMLGQYLAFVIAEAFSTDLYQVPVVYSPATFGTASLAVLAAAIASGWLVKRDINRLDLVETLKTRE